MLLINKYFWIKITKHCKPKKFILIFFKKQKNVFIKSPTNNPKIPFTKLIEPLQNFNKKKIPFKTKYLKFIIRAVCEFHKEKIFLENDNVWRFFFVKITKEPELFLPLLFFKNFLKYQKLKYENFK